MTSFALSVTDALDEAYARDRVASIAALSERCPNLRYICVRDDAMDPGSFSRTASIAAGSGLGVVLESDIPSCLESAADIPGAMVCSPNGDQATVLDIASRTGAVPIISSPYPDELVSMGTPDGTVLNPQVTSMKRCLESVVSIRRRSDRPLMVRAWSGEYALSVASVAVMRGCSLVVVDDLDTDGCAVLDALIENFGKDRRCRT